MRAGHSITTLVVIWKSNCTDKLLGKNMDYP